MQTILENSLSTAQHFHPFLDEDVVIEREKLVGRKVETLSAKELEEIIHCKEFEIVGGKVEKKTMAGARQGRIGMEIGSEIRNFAKANKLGTVYGADTSFQLVDNTRQPDVGYVSFARFPETGEPLGKWEIAPDLAVEVISPTNSYAEIFGKIDEYFEAGTKEVWVVEPERKVLTVYHSPMKSTILGIDDELVGTEVLPNFRLKLSEIFVSAQK